MSISKADYSNKAGYLSAPKCEPCVLPAVQLSSAPVMSPPPETYIQYIPYQKTIFQYQQVQRVERVPRQVVTNQFQVVKKRGRRPVERMVTDYYTVEHIVQYEPQYITEKKVQYIPREVVQQKVEYVPYERQIVHYPIQAMQPGLQQSLSKFQSARQFFPQQTVRSPEPRTQILPPKIIQKQTYQPSQYYNTATLLKTPNSFIERIPEYSQKVVEPVTVNRSYVDRLSDNTSQRSKRRGTVYRNANARPGMPEIIQFRGPQRDTVIFESIDQYEALQPKQFTQLLKAPVILSPTIGSQNQRFVLKRVNQAFAIQLYDGQFVVQPKDKLVLQGQKLQLGVPDYSDSQLFVFEPTGEQDRFFIICSRNRSLALTSSESSVQLRTLRRERNQKWLCYNLAKLI